MTNVSFNPDDFAEGGGGLLDDVDALITGMRFDRDCTYGGRITDPVLALEISMVIQNPTEGQDPQHVEFMSAGSRDYFEVEDNGHKLLPLGSKTQLHKNTKAAQFLTSIVQAGFDASQMGDSIAVLEGITVHLSRREVGKGHFGGTHDEQGRPKTILLCDRIVALPGQAAPKATASTAPIATGTTDPTEIIMGILQTRKAIEVPDLYQAMFESMKNDPNRNSVIKMVGANDNKFLTDGPWKFDGTTVSL